MKTSNVSRSHPGAIIDGWVDGIALPVATDETLYENAAGVTISAGDVVILDVDGTVVLTTTAQETRPVGVALDNILWGALGSIAWQGTVPKVNVSVAVTAGYYAETDAIAGKATQNATRRAGSFAMFTSSGYAPSAFLFGGGSGVPPTAGGLSLELDYTQITANVTITATVEASATTIVTGGAVTFDGSTAVMIEFYAPFVESDNSAAGDNVLLNLFQDGSDIGRLLFIETTVTANRVRVPVHVMRRLTPSAGSHTYSIRGWSTANAGANVQAGAGGASASMPAFIRITTA